MLSRRQKVALTCACLVVLLSVVLAVVHLASGAWVQAVVWIGVALAFAIPYAMSLARWRRT